MRTEDEVRKMCKLFDDCIENAAGHDDTWDAIVDTLRWVLGESRDLSEYEPHQA